MSIKSVKVPEAFEQLFQAAHDTISDHFARMETKPSQGEIRIDGERYILARGASFISSLIDRMENQFGEEVMRAFIYDLAKAIGRSDAQFMAKKLHLNDPAARLSAGPVHFAFTGWAFVDISPESRPAPNDEYVLLYDHPNTFESEHYKGSKMNRVTCFFSAGYSAGWCSDAFGLDLDAAELQCVSRGDAQCRFVMAPPSQLDRRIREYGGR